jgi:hypothetical protein
LEPQSDVASALAAQVDHSTEFEERDHRRCKLRKEYRLGSKSALEWIIDQYQLKGGPDPNREDDPGYIVRLVGQVVRVSIKTVRIVNSLPEFRLPSLVSST